MSKNTEHVITITTEGLTEDEIEDLEAHLKKSFKLGIINRDYPPANFQPDGTLTLQAAAETFAILVAIKQTAIVGAAAKALGPGWKAFSEKVGSTIGDIVSDWLNAKFKNKRGTRMSVTLEEPNGKKKTIKPKLTGATPTKTARKKKTTTKPSPKKDIKPTTKKKQSS